MTPLDQVREYCRQAGIKPGTPLEGALVILMDACQVTREASIEARQAVAGARGLTPDGEAALVKRVTDRIVGAVHVQLQITVSHMRTRALWASAGIIVAGALAIGGGCYYWGRTDGVASVQAIAVGVEDAFKGGPDMAAAWLRLMRANNPVAALAACKALPATKESGMRRGCWLPMWLDPPAMSPPQI